MKITWEVEDGYVGKSRPHTTKIDDENLKYYEEGRERENFITECIEDDFRDKVTWAETSRE